MNLALQRARTAREAIQVMTRLVAEYGYGDEGESFSIADTQEAWILEMVGTGPGGKGAAWVAVRIPDGQVSCHANASRIGEFPRDDPANCLYSENVESFARSKGWYDPKSGQPFRFCEAYCPATPPSRRICDTRVWSILRRAAPVAASLARLPSLQARLAALSVVAAAGRQALGGRCFRPDARSLRGHGIRHDARRRRRTLRPAAALAAAGLEGRRRGVRLGTPHRHAADRVLLRVAVAGLAAGSRGRPLLVRRGRCLHLLLHSAVLRHRRLAQGLRGRFERASSPGTRHGGSSTSCRTTPI